ncbi:MAG TPA: RidA family protein [Tissierellales bacterium]|nr:RidA family protein [Tissierellales bacterium]
MEKKYVKTENAPSAIGPYSQGIIAGNIVYTSGQLPINPSTGELLKGDIEKETIQCLENVIAIVKEANGALEDIVKVNIYVTNIDNFSKINEIYSEYFSEHKPARSLVEVRRLPQDGNIEIEAIAII